MLEYPGCIPGRFFFGKLTRRIRKLTAPTDVGRALATRRRMPDALFTSGGPGDRTLDPRVLPADASNA